MTVWVVFSPEAELCEVFETWDAADDFRRRNTYTRWLMAQRDIRKE